MSSAEGSWHVGPELPLEHCDAHEELAHEERLEAADAQAEMAVHPSRQEVSLQSHLDRHAPHALCAALYCELHLLLAHEAVHWSWEVGFWQLVAPVPEPELELHASREMDARKNVANRRETLTSAVSS